MRGIKFGPLVFFACTLALLGETFTGRSIGVSDGDTISVRKAGRAVKIRLEGVDCPELGQDFGTRAKQFTSARVFDKTVQAKEYYPDRYGRTVARTCLRSLSGLGKFAIHATRKRMIGVQCQLKAEGKDFCAFEILNLGKYERQHYIGVNPNLREAEQQK